MSSNLYDSCYTKISMQMDSSTPVRLDIEIAGKLLSKKLEIYLELFKKTERTGGWVRFPPSLLEYLQQLGVTHWAELFSKEGIRRYQEANKDKIRAANSAFNELLGESPSPEMANDFLNAFCEELTEAALDETGEKQIPGLEFMNSDPASISIQSLPEDERNNQREVWVTFFVHFYNDMSLAIHGESIFALVSRATEQNDDDALVKAIQIDRSLISYFQSQLWQRSMSGNTDFWDSFAYRANNPPARGRNEHPLLWVLLKDLMTLRCLNRSLTAKRILDIYSAVIKDHPRFSIDDEAVVQRQRRRFLKMYRQPK